MDILGLSLYSVVTSFTPGPNNIMCMYLAARGGLGATHRFIWASMGSFFVKALLCGLLNLALAAVVPGLVPYLKWLGAAYMAYLGLHILLAGIRETRAQKAEGAVRREAEPVAGRGRDAVLLQLLNVKSWVYALSLFSIYIVPYTRAFSAILFWSAATSLVGAAGSYLWAGFGAVISRLYETYRLPCDIVMCLSLVYCAVMAVL